MKISRAEKRRRRAWVERQMREFLPWDLFVSRFVKKFGAGERTLQRYCREVYERWEREGEPDRAKVRGEVQRAAEDAFRLAALGKNPRAMVAAMELKAKLHGLLQRDDGDDAGDLVLNVRVEPDPPPGDLPVDAQPDAGTAPAGSGAVPGAGGRA